MYPYLKFCFCYLFFSVVCLAQPSKPLDKKIVDIQSFEAVSKGFDVPPFTTIQINFELTNTFNQDTTFFIDIGREELGRLYDRTNGQIRQIARAGARVPIPDRSVKNDVRAIKIRLKANETKKLTLAIDNFLPTQKHIKPQLMNGISYQVKVAEKNNTFYQKYWNPGYFSILLLVLLLTVIQYFVLPERVFIYYFFYIFFTFIRSTASVEAIVLEDWIPFLNRIGYSSMHSQVFTYLSFVFYVLFLREFTNFPSKKPRLDYFFKIQLAYLLGFIIFDLIFPNEKFSNFQINVIFRALETLGLILGIINLFLLFKVYDSFNKFIIIGATSLYVIALFGQEIVKRTMNGNENSELFLSSLAIVWTIAYLVEIVFFTIALVNRQRILLKSILFEQNQNKLLAEQLVRQKVNISQEEQEANYESFSLATNRGILVFQQADIVRLEASGNYTIFSIHNHKQTLASYTLSDFEPKLNPSKFIRVHKSHVVNLQYVVKYTKGDGGTLTLQDGSEIPVSRSRKEELLKRLHTV